MIYYENTAGKRVVLDAPPFMADITELAGFELSYQANPYTDRHGGRVDGFTAGIQTKSISVGVLAPQEGIREALDELLAVTQQDVLAGEAGRLYVGEHYLLCNLYGSSVEGVFDPGVEYAEKTYRLVISYPFWCREQVSEYLPGDRAVSEADFLDYPYDYSYDYLFDEFAVDTLDNAHYAPSDFRLVFYGPASDPRVTIGGHLYHVGTTLYDGDYLTVDSRTGTVSCARESGIRENLFNLRDKASDIFQKIPPGVNSVVYDHSFGFSVTLFQERSELPWNIS